jgi:hypothetical protein
MCAYTQNNRERQMKYTERKEESLSIRIACDMKHLPKFFFSFFYYITFFSQAYARFLKWRGDCFYFITLLYAIRRNFVDNFYDCFRRETFLHTSATFYILDLIRELQHRASLKIWFLLLKLKLNKSFVDAIFHLMWNGLRRTFL